MKRSIVFQAAAGLLLVLFCSALALAQDVRYNYLPGTDFSKYKTYKWVEIPGGSQADQIVSAQITQAIDSQLAAKGLTKTDNDNADLYVAYQLAVNQEKQWDAMGYGGYRYNRMGTMTSSTINIGTLVVDMYESAAKKQVWHGDATKTLNPSKDPQKNQEKIQKAVAKLLKNYPPPVKK
jgi:Domain of unknown function (DUF4136)